MRDYDAVVFDMDGVIFDTEKAYLDTWIKVFNKYGYEMKKDNSELRKKLKGLKNDNGSQYHIKQREASAIRRELKNI